MDEIFVTLMGALPVLDTVSVCVDDVFSCTSPKERLAGTPRIGAGIGVPLPDTLRINGLRM